LTSTVDPLVIVRMRMSGPGSATMHESRAGVAQLAEQPSCNGLDELDLTCDQADITDEKWRAFAVAGNCSDSCASLVAAKTLHGKTTTPARQILGCAGYEKSTLSSYARTTFSAFAHAKHRHGSMTHAC
jgi:hypothetical protein